MALRVLITDLVEYVVGWEWYADNTLVFCFHLSKLAKDTDAVACQGH
jgi:hypothetical protein